MRERVLITRPCYDTYEYGNIVTVENMRTETNNFGKYSCIYHFTKGSNIARLREQAVGVGRTVEAKWILSIDSDVFVPQGALLKLLKHDKSIISGVIVSKQEPYEYLVTKKDEQGNYWPVKHLPNGGLYEADAVGFGFMLIKMEVFDKIEPPYFVMGDILGEDLYFCQKAKEAGFHIWVDVDCQLGHIGQTIFSVDDHNACHNIPKLVDVNGKAIN